MGKKYVPSGYQIININVTKESNEYVIEENEDSETLKEILLKRRDNHYEVFKPILLNVICKDILLSMTGFVIINFNAIYIADSSMTVNIYVDGDGQLKIEITEL